MQLDIFTKVRAFALVEEKLGSQWGIEVLEQRFTRSL
jgi:hypothetical protein